MLVARDPKLHEYILFHTSGASTEDTLKGSALKKAQQKQACAPFSRIWPKSA